MLSKRMWPIATVHSIKQGECHVLEKKKKQHQNVLRGLTSNSIQQGGSILLPAGIESNESIKSKHKNLLKNSLTFSFALYLRSCMSSWHILLKKGESFRLISPDWNSSFTLICNKIYQLRPSDSFDLVNYTEAEKYNLGFYKNINLERCSPFLKNKVKIRSGQASNDILKNCNKDHRSIYLSLFLLYSPELLNKKETVEELENSVNEISNPVYKIHTLNSVNLYHIKESNFERLKFNLNLVDIEIQKIKSNILSKQIEAIVFYHRSVLERLLENDEKETFYLMRAIEKDHSFYDYHYRLAQKLHDKGDQNATKYYINAIERSPFDLNIVNDFGIILNELESDDLGSLEHLYRSISES